MAKPNNNEPVSPREKDIANVPPTDIGGGAGHTRLVVEALKETVSDIKSDLKDVKNEVKEIRNYRHTDLLWHIGAFAAIVATIIAVYFKIDDRFHRLDDRFTRLEDKLNQLSTGNVRVDTKLEDLLQRLPPASSPNPKK